jgi:hypothetical protein
MGKKCKECQYCDPPVCTKRNTLVDRNGDACDQFENTGDILAETELHNCIDCDHLKFIDYGYFKCSYWGRSVDPHEMILCSARRLKEK